uniref:Uncharacterized protein n=1 Tax=Cercocebus atys TaxID=9531 RepID=A0A2K5NSW5_CERAT
MYWSLAFLPMVCFQNEEGEVNIWEVFPMDQEGISDFAEIIIDKNDGKEALNMGCCHCTGWTTRWSSSQSLAHRQRIYSTITKEVYSSRTFCHQTSGTRRPL